MAPKGKAAEKPGGKPGDKPGGKPGDKPGGKPGDKPGDKPGGKPGDKPGDKPQPPGTPVVLTRGVIIFWIIILIALLLCLVGIILMFSKYKTAKEARTPYDEPLQRLGIFLATSLGKPNLKQASAPMLATTVEGLPIIIKKEHDEFNAKKTKYKTILVKAMRSSSGPWKLHGRSLYYFSKGAKTWYDAESFCISRDAHLVSVGDDEEQNFIISQLQHASWIGLTVGNDDGIWSWSDGSQLMTQYWSDGRPKKAELFGESRQDCTLMVPSLTVRNWHDESCHNLYGWICKENLDLGEP